LVIGMQQEPDSLHPLFGSMSANAVIRAAFLVGCFDIFNLLLENYS
jgi:hypothetical protein